MPIASIIIPVYNAEKYIKATIDSVLSQTFSDWELLLIDDCSMDNTPAICKELSKNDERIIYIKQVENGGPAKARNTGLEQAKGEFVTFVDSDDIIEPTFLDRMLITALDNHSDIVWCNFKEIWNNEILHRKHNLPCNVSIPYETYIRLFFYKQEGLGSMCNKLYRKHFLEQNKIRLNPERVRGEDWEFNLNCFKCHPILVAIDDYLYNYVRQNNSSVMATYHACDYQNLVKKHLILHRLSQEEGIKYDVMNSKFIYHAIELLVSLKRSSMYNKKSEFKKIINDDFFHKFLTLGYNDVSYLPPKFKLYFFLIKYHFIDFAYFIMK